MNKNNKNSLKGSKQGILIAVIVFVIVAFVIVECYGVLNVRLQTQEALASTVYETIDTRALFIRDEHTVSAGSGITIAAVSDGEKVNSGGQISMMFASDESAQRYSNYIELDELRRHYTDMENTAVGSVSDIDVLENSIVSDINNYVRCAAYSDIEGAKDYSLDVNDNLTKRSILVGEPIDFSSSLTELENKISALDISTCKPTGYVTADTAGYYSKYTDGCEGAFDYSKVKDMDVNTFNEYLMQAVSSKGTTQNGGKIISSFVWYLCCVVNAEDVDGLEDGYNTQVVIKSTDQELKCTVIKGAEVSLTDNQTLLVLACNEMDNSLSSMRLEDIEIRVKSHTGIIVNSSAVHDINGEKGVYALVSNIAKWRKADILYTGEDYVVLSYDDPDVSNGIKLYDRIIIRGRDVYDGKVFA